MKKFGTPIGAAPGVDEREGRVVERRRAVDVAAGRRRSPARSRASRAFFLHLALEGFGVGAGTLAGALGRARPDPVVWPPLAGPAAAGRRGRRRGAGRVRRAGVPGVPGVGMRQRRRGRRRPSGSGSCGVGDRASAPAPARGPRRSTCGAGSGGELRARGRRALGDLDGEGHDLARGQRHAHLVQLRRRRAHEHGRVERGGHRGGEEGATDHPARYGTLSSGAGRMQRGTADRGEPCGQYWRIVGAEPATSPSTRGAGCDSPCPVKLRVCASVPAPSRLRTYRWRTHHGRRGVPGPARQAGRGRPRQAGAGPAGEPAGQRRDQPRVRGARAGRRRPRRPRWARSTSRRRPTSSA